MNNYGSIGEKSDMEKDDISLSDPGAKPDNGSKKDQNLDDKSASTSMDPIETPIEEALENAGLTWVHFKLLVIMGVIVMSDYIELEVNSLLGKDELIYQILFTIFFIFQLLSKTCSHNT